MSNTKAPISTESKSRRPESKQGSAEAPQTRLNVHINSQTATALKTYAEKHGLSVTEAVRRLIAVGDFIAKAQEDGKHILVRDGKETERIVFSY